VSYDDRLPPVFAPFQDCEEQPHAWAWLMVPAAADAIRLSWTAGEAAGAPAQSMPSSLEVLRFQLQRAPLLERVAGRRRWRWSRHA
jgi:hypothetical protein